ncbi:RrF2 family transcriptional regulator [Desulfonatronum parangueonense]
MMLTKAGEYSVRCMLFLAGKQEQDIVLKKDVSEAMRIPVSFLAKIAQNLAKAGLIQIVQGPRGGYRMLRTPEEVTLLEVIEAVEGEIFLNECLFRPDSCHRSVFCGVHRVWTDAREGLRSTLSVPLSDLLCAEDNHRPRGGGDHNGSDTVT